MITVPRNALVLAPAFDSGGAHPADSHGVFVPGARAFSKHYGLNLPYLWDNHPTSLPARFQQILDYISRTVGKIDTFASFSHGLRRQFQFGLTIDNVQEFARALLPFAAEEMTLIFYACSAGEDPTEVGGGHEDDAPGAGDGSICDAVRDALNGLGVKARVLGHSTVGHAFHNAHVRTFEPGATAGGEWLISPKSSLWSKWDHSMAVGDMWERMPFLTTEHITAELTKP